MSLTVFHGLPTHVLLVHFVVVLVPLTALALVVCAVWPRAARRMGPVLPLLALVTLAIVPFTTHAGGWLRDRLPATELIDRHAGLGDDLLPWVIALAVMSAVVWWLTLPPRFGGVSAGAPTPARKGRRTPVRTSGPPAPADPRGTGRVAAWTARFPRTLRVTVVALALAAAAGAVVDVYRIGDSGAKAVWQGVVSPPAGQDHG